MKRNGLKNHSDSREDMARLVIHLENFQRLRSMFKNKRNIIKKDENETY